MVEDRQKGSKFWAVLRAIGGNGAKVCCSAAGEWSELSRSPCENSGMESRRVL